MKGQIAKEEIEQESYSSIEATSYECCPLRNMIENPISNIWFLT